MANEHDDIGFVEDSPESHSDLGFIPDKERSGEELLQAARNDPKVVDTFTPEEQQEYKKAFDQHGEDFRSGIMSGLPKAVGLKQEEVSPIIERGIANLIGDEQTQELYKNTSDEQLKQAYIDAHKQAVKRSPADFSAGEFIGSMIPSLAIGGAGGAVANAANLGRAGTVAANIGTGALAGELQGIGQSQADTLGERAVEALPLAALGAGGSALFEGAAALATPEGKALASKAADKIKSVANRRAYESLDPTLAARKKIASKGISEDIGNVLLEGENPILGPLTSNEAKLDALTPKLEQAGAEVGAATKGISETAENIKNLPEPLPPIVAPYKPDEVVNELQFLPGGKTAASDMEPNTSFGGNIFQPKTAVTQTESRLIPVEKIVPAGVDEEFAKRIAARPPSVQQQVAQIANPESIADSVRSAPFYQDLVKTNDPGKVLFHLDEQLSKLANLDDTSIANIVKYRQGLDNLIGDNFDKASKQLNSVGKALKSYRAEVDKQIMERAAQVDKIAGTNYTKELAKAKRQYYILKKTNDLAFDAAARAEGKSVLDGSIKKTGIAKKLIKTYGNNFAASSLNKLSKAVNATPDVFGKYAPILQNAEKRGATGLAATHYMLYQRDPKYREIIDPLQEEGEAAVDQENQE